MQARLVFPGAPGVEPGAGVPHAPPFMVFSMSVFGASARRHAMVMLLKTLQKQFALLWHLFAYFFVFISDVVPGKIQMSK